MDQHHPVVRAYDRLLEDPPDDSLLKRELWRLIDQDPLFFDPYLDLANIVMEEGRPREAHGIVRAAYERALPLIAGTEGSWPRRMEWGCLENRHILRTIMQYALVLWEEGEPEEALDMFRRLLKMNPHDNLGARFAILAMRLGLGPEWEDAFVIEHGPMAGQALDADRVDGWFRRNARKFQEEFGRQFKEWGSAGYQ